MDSIYNYLPEIIRANFYLFLLLIIIYLAIKMVLRILLFRWLKNKSFVQKLIRKAQSIFLEGD